jgi:hypothetical protein
MEIVAKNSSIDLSREIYRSRRELRSRPLVFSTEVYNTQYKPAEQAAMERLQVNPELI